MADSSARSPHSQSELNSWLVEEMYEQFRDDPSALPKGWQDFFADYRPDDAGGPNGSGGRDRVRDGGEPGADRAASTSVRKAVASLSDDDEPTRLRGVGARIVENMEVSLGVPTATSVRDVPAKLLEVNRRIINNYLKRTRGGKVSFTHLIAYAIVKAVADVPAMTTTFTETEDGKPATLRREDFGLGLAVDIENDDGSRSLLVPVIKDANTLSFEAFLRAYEEIIRKIRTKKLDPAMFSGGTITLTNPGGIGTVHSIPRLMAGQSAIIGVGALAHPAEYQATDARTLAKLGVGKVITLTSTYDHRVIQGAESGLYLNRVHQLLLGEDGFYDEVFRSLGLPYEPARWRRDSTDVDSHTDLLTKQMKVGQLANNYRVRGHLIADLDPLRQRPPSMHPELDPTTYGLSIWDNDREFLTDIGGGERKMKLGDIMGVLRDAYCRTIGIEYGHVLDPEEKAWIRAQVEGVEADVDPEDQPWILERLNAAEAFESFLHTKYVGQKRFGLEGAESLIPLLDAVAESAAMDEDTTDIVMGMAHRGRLNVLSNIVGKSHRQIFGEFEGHIDPDTVQGSGDVKYHLGTNGTYTARSGDEVALHLPPNPSHLEAVNPVVEGIVRAKQDRYDRGDEEIYPVVPLLMHGDAAFAGQGVVVETLNLSQLRGYRTGGTIHVVINNQVGFTTSPEESRSSFYATDVAKTVQAPILHVNGDDPEAVVRVARLAFDYRRTFHRDIVIDLICYRRHGHNEADDPSYTQPQMYELIDAQRSVRKLYTERLVRRGDISIEQAEDFLEDFESRLQQAFDETKQGAPPEPPKAVAPQELGVLEQVDTGVDKGHLDRIAAVQFELPDGFTRHPKLDRIFKKARERYDAGSIDWALGETLAFGSLLLEGTNVRLAGQDSRRGTFSQRHAVQVGFHSGDEYLPLAHLSADQGKWFLYDSLLSEYAAVGFEYGYSVEDKDALVAWEAQFGDFVNGAQIIIDQFIVAAEDKWNETSGLVLLLPHGYEGQGPEHSSARIERFLTLCAEDNIQVVNATTSAQYFHVLRRQMHRSVRKPLIVFTPKSLLRSPMAFSDISRFTDGSFGEVLDDPRYLEAGAGDGAGAATEEGRERAGGDRDAVRSVVLCSGKVAYDIMAARDERERPAAVVRVEQLYPFPAESIGEILRAYPNAKDICWTQEEPENMGSWGFVDGRLWNLLESLDDGRTLRHATRVPSASPAAGQHVVHEQELELLMADTLDPVPTD
jgi:multifunctional 2-oxoglutarate metabolism enzyme